MRGKGGSPGVKAAATSASGHWGGEGAAAEPPGDSEGILGALRGFGGLRDGLRGSAALRWWLGTFTAWGVGPNPRAS